jgi:tRNA(Ile)-lysidine synthase
MKNRKSVFDRVLAFCKQEKLLESGDTVLLALSGGKDSVVLLHMLRKMQGYFSLQLGALHLNHGLRGEAALHDEAFCKKLCQAWNIPLHVFSVPVDQIAKDQGVGLEEAGRQERYRFLEIVAQEEGYTKVATAHTQSDHSETVLMHLIRGAGLRGLAGIPAQRERIIRPLLCIPTEDVLLYARENDLAFCQDETNEDTRYLRNHIRHTILPSMKKSNPALDNSLMRMSRVVSESDVYFTFRAKQALADMGGGFQTPLPLSQVKDLFRAPGSLLPAEALLKQWLGQSLSYEQVQGIKRLLLESKSQAQFNVGNHITVEIAGDFFQIKPIHPEKANLQEVFLQEGYNPLPGYAFAVWLLACSSSENFENILQKDYTFYVSSDTIGRPMVRIRQEGDQYRAGGHTKKVKKIFADRKIPRAVRDTLPIVCDERGIICGPFLPLADRAKGLDLKIVFVSEDDAPWKQ